MQRRVLVTVRRDEESDGRDLELPASLSFEELTRLLGPVLHWPQVGNLRARLEPDGRVLAPGESLRDAGAVDGALLVFSATEPQGDPPIVAPAWPTFVPAKPLAAERVV